jgi:lipoprotein-releasing system ATP-binding protein
MTRDTVLQTIGLSKYFDDPVRFQVLQDVSFEVKRGEFLSIIGKSGSGKSTLLYCLSTMDTDYTGTLMIEGQQVNGQKSDQLAEIRNRSIGFVFQFHYLLPDFSCLQNVMIPALKRAQLPEEAIEQKAYELLSMLGVRDQALKPASKLSGGQQQRVAIARALVNDPTIIMGDEPTGNLDTKNTRVVMDIFKQLSEEFHQTVIAVTHDADFARSSHRVIEMEDGRILSSRTN